MSSPKTDAKKYEYDRSQITDEGVVQTIREELGLDAGEMRNVIVDGKVTPTVVLNQQKIYEILLLDYVLPAMTGQAVFGVMITDISADLLPYFCGELTIMLSTGANIEIVMGAGNCYVKLVADTGVCYKFDFNGAYGPLVDNQGGAPITLSVYGRGWFYLPGLV